MGAVPTQQVTWVQPNVAPARAQVLIYRLTITEEGNPTPRVVGLTNVLCGGAANAAECSTVLPVNGQSAIVTGNSSTLRATDPETGAAGPSSAEFVGNQGCIFRDNLYKIGDRAQAQTRRQDMSNLLNEFQAAKFDHVSTTNLKGNQYLVIEECTGKIQPNAAVSRALKTSEEVKENK
jgi:hypothetical protein